MQVSGLEAADFSASETRFAINGGHRTVGIIDLDPIDGTERIGPDFSQSSTVWSQESDAPDYIVTHHTVIDLPPVDPDSLKGSGATEWPDWEERMTAISRMFEQYHTDADLYRTSDLEISFQQIGWLDEDAMPR